LLHDPIASPYEPDPVADLAGGVLAELYRAVCGHDAAAVRAYHDDEALLLLLRFDPDEMAEVVAADSDDELEGAFVAMPGMIVSAVEAGSGHRMRPANLSVCADRGLAVFAFSSLEDADDDGGDADALPVDRHDNGMANRHAVRLAN
jgi:hypothetical protein